MNNRWTKLNSKKEIIIFFGLIILYFVFDRLSKFIPSLKINFYFLLIFITLFLFILAISFLLKGIEGLQKNKITSLYPLFTREYKINEKGIYSREKKYKGLFAILRSIFSILIGLLFLIIIGIIIYNIFLI